MPSQRLTDSLRQLDQLNTRVDVAARQSSTVNISGAQVKQIAEQAVNNIRQEIKNMVIKNYNDSDFAKADPTPGYHHTGKIRNAVLTCEITGDFRAGKAWKINVLYKAGIPPYVYKPTKKGHAHSTPFYKVAASLNYGAVIPPGNKRYSTTYVAKRKAKLIAAQNRKNAPGLFQGTQEIQAEVSKKDDNRVSMKVLER
jgi:hypothetical protein